MIDFLYYIIVIISVLIIIIVIYIKYYFHLWINLPVNNLLCFYYNYGIIQNKIEKRHKLINNENIKTYQGNKIHNLLIKNIDRWFKKNTYTGLKLYRYYDKHKYSFVSCYYKSNFLLNKETQTYLDNPDIIASISSREIKFLSNDFSDCTIHFLDEFIFDSNKNFANKDMYFVLLKTHMQNIYLSTNIIRPAIFLSSYHYPLTNFCKINIYLLKNIQSTCKSYLSYLPQPITKWEIIGITNANFYLLKHFLRKNQFKFDILLKSNVSTLLTRINKKDILLKILLIDGEIRAFYSFSYIYELPLVHDSLNHCIYLIASITNTSISLFQFGLYQTLSKHTLPDDSLYIMDIADNHLLIKNIDEKCIYNNKYFYCYNLKHKIYDSRKIFYL